MNDSNLRFLATPSLTMPNTWVGLVVERGTGIVRKQTMMTYRSKDEARFGARRGWVGAQRAVERHANEVA